MALLWWLTFVLRSLTLTLTVLFFWIYLFLLIAVFVLQWLYSKRDAPFHCIAYDYSCADWDGLHDHLRDVPWEDIFKFSASAAASEFCEWVQVGIDIYVPHLKYQVKPHSSSWFSAAYAPAIVSRNHSFP